MGIPGIPEHPFIAHQFVEEARIQQMQNRMFDAADVLVHRQPVLCGCLVHHAGGASRADVARVIPARFHEGIHGVGLAPGLRTALRAAAFVKFRQLRQR